ncbi:MAG: OB-fold nucleic acid binding domain-containing protein [Candidatus Pacearchaeota archaeon]|nr:OB-fold nucleic acid binding domain-containing protein [Candidatus Pacearchaeota archaeon]
MKTKNLLKLSLIISIFGIFLILFLANNLEPNFSDISNITQKELDNYVKIKGEIIDTQEIFLNDSEYLELFTIKDGSGSIEGVFRKRMSLQTNQQVEILGKVSDYKGAIQIEASKIKIIS